MPWARHISESDLSQRLGGSSPNCSVFICCGRFFFSSWQTVIVTLRQSPCFTRLVELMDYWSKYKFGAVDSKALLASSVLAPVLLASLTRTNESSKIPESCSEIHQQTADLFFNQMLLCLQVIIPNRTQTQVREV